MTDWSTAKSKSFLINIAHSLMYQHAVPSNTLLSPSVSRGPRAPRVICRACLADGGVGDEGERVGAGRAGMPGDMTLRIMV